MSARLRLVMAHKDKPRVMCGDAGNIFPNDPTNEKSRAVAGEEFEERQGCIVETTKSSCGMPTASRSFTLCLGDFTRTLGHAPSRDDLDVWTKRDHNYDGRMLMSTHVCDFLIIQRQV